MGLPFLELKWLEDLTLAGFLLDGAPAELWRVPDESHSPELANLGPFSMLVGCIPANLERGGTTGQLGSSSEVKTVMLLRSASVQRTQRKGPDDGHKKDRSLTCQCNPPRSPKRLRLIRAVEGKESPRSFLILA